MVYLAKGSFWFAFSQAIVSLSSFGLAIAFAHFLTKEAYGQYKYILSIAGLLGTITLTGLPSAVMRAISQGYDGTLSYAFWKNIRWSAISALAAALLGGYYFYKGNNSLGISMLFVGSLWPFFQSSNLYNSYLVAKKDFKRNAIYFEIIGNIFPILALLLTMTQTGNPTWLVATYLVSNTFIGLILYRRVISIYAPRGPIDEHALGYSKHLSFMGILSGIAAHLDQILVFQYIGAAELAIYNFATAIPNQAKGPLKGLSTLMFPKFVERDEKEIQSGMNHKYLVMFMAGLALTIVYICAAPYIFYYLFPQYTDSIIYSQIFALSFLSITFNPADVYLSAKKKIHEQYIGTLTNAVIQIIMTFVAIINWGLLGLIIARVAVRMLGNLTSLALYHYSIKRDLKLHGE